MFRSYERYQRIELDTGDMKHPITEVNGPLPLEFDSFTA